MWTEVYFSQKEEKVRHLVDLLDGAGIISRVRERSDRRSKCFVVLVPRTELDEAQSMIVESDLF